MKRTEFREKIVQLLYIFSVGGDYLKENFTDEIIERYNDILQKINEAINLTKKLSNLDDDSQKRFNNKLLDNIRKSLEK